MSYFFLQLREEGVCAVHGTLAEDLCDLDRQRGELTEAEVLRDALQRVCGAEGFIHVFLSEALFEQREGGVV